MDTLQKTGLESELLYLPIHIIKQNPQQPRLVPNNKKLLALVDSIKLSGVLEPVLVCWHVDHYILIAGHRRLAAAIKAGLEEIPARILPAQIFDVLGIAVAENMLREDLNTLEVAMALAELADRGVGRKELCIIAGLSLPSISELLRLKTIPRDVGMQCIDNGHTSKRFLNQLSLYSGEDAIIAAYQYFLEHKQLPPRQKRHYTSNKEKKTSLELLIELNQSLEEPPRIDYSDESEFADMFRVAVGNVLMKLKNQGWFLSNKFDVSNLTELIDM